MSVAAKPGLKASPAHRFLCRYKGDNMVKRQSHAVRRKLFSTALAMAYPDKPVKAEK